MLNTNKLKCLEIAKNTNITQWAVLKSVKLKDLLYHEIRKTSLIECWVAFPTENIDKKHTRCPQKNPIPTQWKGPMYYNITKEIE